MRRSNNKRVQSASNVQSGRTFPVGAEVLPQGGVSFRVWAPRCRRLGVVLESMGATSSRGSEIGIELEREKHGYFSGYSAEAKPGQHYRFRLNDRRHLCPDPASRFQPEGPHGFSEIVDPKNFAWTDGQWKGVPPQERVVYEMHVGTFTREGTWEAAAEELPELSKLGITLLEIMPVSDFPGRFGWGYDGVNLFAPTRLYGKPDDFRAFVNRAHSLRIGVILDAVYNHVGPDGNYLKEFSEDYFTDRYKNDWGEAINFDGPNNGPVREFFLANARYWIHEYHLDGLRLDATQQIFDSSSDHILAAITREVRQAAKGRATFIVAENEPQHTKLVRPVKEGGFGIDASWNDDFHHSARVALTGRNEAYFSDYLGKPQEFISAMKWGCLYQGQRSAWQKQRRGTPTFGLDHSQFINFIQNHDQVAHSLRGARLHLLTSAGRYRAMTALLLLGPSTPMLFQGQEFASSAPFLYFADHKPELAKLVREGRQEFLSQFPNLNLPETQAILADPASPKTFRSCKLDFSERKTHSDLYRLHQDLLAIRRQDVVLRARRAGGVDGAVLGEEAFLLRFFGDSADDRLLIVNLGRALLLDRAPEPLLAPPAEAHWIVHWSSEHPRYGGYGTPPVETKEHWRIPGHSAVLLVPEINRDGQYESDCSKDRTARNQR